MPPETINPRDYGRLEADVMHLQDTVTTMQADIRAMRDILEQSKGGWRTMVMLGGVASTLGAAASWAVHGLWTPK
jgi:hypothetical protein